MQNALPRIHGTMKQIAAVLHIGVLLFVIFTGTVLAIIDRDWVQILIFVGVSVLTNVTIHTVRAVLVMREEEVLLKDVYSTHDWWYKVNMIATIGILIILMIDQQWSVIPFKLGG